MTTEQKPDTKQKEQPMKTKSFTKTSIERSKRLAKRAFTLIEILITVAIIGIVLSIAVPALSSSRQDSIETAARGNAKTLNDARTRAKIKGDTNSVLDGEDAVAAATYLIGENYIQTRN